MNHSGSLRAPTDTRIAPPHATDTTNHPVGLHLTEELTVEQAAMAIIGRSLGV